VGHQNSSRSIVTRRSKRCMVKTWCIMLNLTKQ
jgi:hypothetical protein